MARCGSGCDTPSPPVRRDLDGHRPPVDAGAQAAQVGRQPLGQHRLDPARQVDRRPRRAASASSAEPAGTRADTSAMCTKTRVAVDRRSRRRDPRASGSTVKHTRSRRSRRSAIRPERSDPDLGLLRPRAGRALPRSRARSTAAGSSGRPSRSSSAAAAAVRLDRDQVALPRRPPPGGRASAARRTRRTARRPRPAPGDTSQTTRPRRRFVGARQRREPPRAANVDVPRAPSGDSEVGVTPRPSTGRPASMNRADRQLERAAAGQRLDRLHRALAVGGAPRRRSRRAPSKRTGDDLGGAGGRPVDHHGHRSLPTAVPFA